MSSAASVVNAKPPQITGNEADALGVAADANSVTPRPATITPATSTLMILMVNPPAAYGLLQRCSALRSCVHLRNATRDRGDPAIPLPGHPDRKLRSSGAHS